MHSRSVRCAALQDEEILGKLAKRKGSGPPNEANFDKTKPSDKMAHLDC
jgi:hypothetical protein